MLNWPVGILETPAGLGIKGATARTNIANRLSKMFTAVGPIRDFWPKAVNNTNTLESKEKNAYLN